MAGPIISKLLTDFFNEIGRRQTHDAAILRMRTDAVRRGDLPLFGVAKLQRADLVRGQSAPSW